MNKFVRLPWYFVINLVLVYLVYAVCRVAFVLENWYLFGEHLTMAGIFELVKGCIIFDTAAICYTNALYVLMVCLPVHHFKSKAIERITRWSFILPNALAVIVNLMDTVYFTYTQKRVTAKVFSEFSNEGNLGVIFGEEFLVHWYFVLLAVLLIAVLYKGYRGCPEVKRYVVSSPMYYVQRLLILVIAAFVMICGVRGSFLFTKTRPIAMSNALQYVERPLETNIVLNTPFSVIRTLFKRPQTFPKYFADHEVVDSLYSPVHLPKENTVVRKKNVVILIVESFAQEFIGFLNKHLEDGTYQGYTPFVDSLMTHSLTFRETFGNTWTSIDAMPAVLAAMPKMDVSFILTPYSLNKVNGIAGELKTWGYETAFFHGAENGSMGFQAFARTIGFRDYYGRAEFNQDLRFGGDAEFDGAWGVWDEPFLQYYCMKMNEMKEPFITSVFTLSSHHPFRIPDKYKDVFKDEGKHLLHKCIRYADHALRHFFETASKQPWYKNTIFIITADHASSKTTHKEYETALGKFRVPIIFFDPSGEMPVGVREGIAQHIDIMPTVLNYLGYDRPYVAFGKDLLNTEPKDTWAMLWYYELAQYVKGDYFLLFGDGHPTGLYNYKKDTLLTTNLQGQCDDEAMLEQRLKAFLQVYGERMEGNQLTVE